VKFIVRCPDGKIRNGACEGKAATEKRAAELDDACLYEMPFSSVCKRTGLRYTKPSSCPW